LELRRHACVILIGKPEGKRPLGKPRHKGVDNIKMDLGEIVWDDIERTDLAKDRFRLEGSCEPGNEPSGSVKR
jgi:hypothetical protein